MTQTDVQTQVGTMSNSAVRDLFSENLAFANGEVIIADIEETSNPDVKALVLIQHRKDLKVTASSMNPLVQLTMGLPPLDGRTVRCWHNIDAEIMASLKGLKPGVAALPIFKQLSEDIQSLKIAVVESHNPRIWANKDGVEQVQKPVTLRNGKTLTSEGRFIYQHTELCANNSVEDVQLTVDRI